MITHRWIQSNLGRICIVATRDALTGLFFEEQKYFPHHLLDTPCDPSTSEDRVTQDLLDRVADQIEEYFAGTRQQFEIPTLWTGTTFQRAVWESLMDIPFGQTASYQNIADRLGTPKATRAVGSAIGRNPISLICPCHRVVSTNGNLTGYAGGIDRKRWLLDHERENNFFPTGSELSSTAQAGVLG